MGAAGQAIPTLDSLKQIKAHASRLKAQGLKAIHLELDSKVTLESLLPALHGSGLGGLRLSNMSMSYCFEGTDDDLPGAYFGAELPLVGELEDIGTVVTKLTGIRRPVMQLHAYLGLILEDDESMKFTYLSLDGRITGLSVIDPQGLKGSTLTTLGLELRVGNLKQAEEDEEQDEEKEVSVVGQQVGLFHADIRQSTKAKIAKVVTENVVKYAKKKMTEPKKNSKKDDDKDKDEATKKKEKEEQKNKSKKKRAAWLKKTLKAAADKAIEYIQLRLYGSLSMIVPGQEKMLELDFAMQNTGKVISFDMWPSNNKKWDDAFGFDWLDVSEAVPSLSLKCILLTATKLQEVSFSARLDVGKLLPDNPESEEPGSEENGDGHGAQTGPNFDTRSKGKRSLELADSILNGHGPVKKARQGDEHQEEDDDEVLFDGAFEDSDDDESAKDPSPTDEPALVIAMHAEWITPVTSEPIVVDGQIRGRDCKSKAIPMDE